MSKRMDDEVVNTITTVTLTHKPHHLASHLHLHPPSNQNGIEIGRYSTKLFLLHHPLLLRRDAHPLHHQQVISTLANRLHTNPTVKYLEATSFLLQIEMPGKSMNIARNIKNLDQLILVT